MRSWRAALLAGTTAGACGYSSCESGTEKCVSGSRTPLLSSYEAIVFSLFPPLHRVRSRLLDALLGCKTGDRSAHVVAAPADALCTPAESGERKSADMATMLVRSRSSTERFEGCTLGNSTEKSRAIAVPGSDDPHLMNEDGAPQQLCIPFISPLSDAARSSESSFSQDSNARRAQGAFVDDDGTGSPLSLCSDRSPCSDSEGHTSQRNWHDDRLEKSCTVSSSDDEKPGQAEEQRQNSLHQPLLQRVSEAFLRVKLDQTGQGDDISAELFCEAALATVGIFDIFRGAAQMVGEMARRDCAVNVGKIRRGMAAAREACGAVGLRGMVEYEMKGRSKYELDSGTEGLVWLTRNLQFETLLIIILLEDIVAVSEEGEKRRPRATSDIAVEAFRICSLSRKYAWWMKIMFENALRIAPPRDDFIFSLAACENLDVERSLAELANIIYVVNEVNAVLVSNPAIDAETPFLDVHRPYVSYDV
ncbi:hypothetical protein FVE85_6263 [Porphyridium purpureum]|uniref:Glycolipid transfer protein domain-containing protein n=1 Tax=Porphyridium purpureum TaxID=35688 RepID=A0A5J4Z628_PORPP|nr:hypothetical protein FVE85_6263 [Porphyridium purpureum]|eukprot:POR8980..scf295_1